MIMWKKLVDLQLFPILSYGSDLWSIKKMSVSICVLFLSCLCRIFVGMLVCYVLCCPCKGTAIVIVAIRNILLLLVVSDKNYYTQSFIDCGDVVL